ncbi:maleylpyruvate isomerase family mycothiol-dependent enzyme [Solwaraspora sp. WMMB762]|uniref:maleylpyruvate isomerase family mycothiol-dependent enzyme n=1 Tax=Solwaraspora sp. WMMB762 TaxID=3404120 RepID=UPI003B9584AC
MSVSDSVRAESDASGAGPDPAGPTPAGPTPAGPAAAGYRQVRRNVAELLTAGSPDLAAAVPGCPDWSIADLASHLVQVCARVHERIVSGEAAAEGTGGGPPPAGIQFSLLPADRATAPLPAGGIGELLDDWTRLSGPVEQFLGEPFSVRRGILVMDAFTHELDLRQALGVDPPAPEHPALPVAMGILAKGLSLSTRNRSLPALRVETDLGQWPIGEGALAATVAGSWHDVYQAMSGRLTEERIRALRWSADPAPWIAAFTWGPFVVPGR